MSKRGDEQPAIDFEAELKPVRPGSKAAYVQVPAALASVFGSRARVPVRITLRGHSFLASLGPRGDGDFYVVVNEKMRKTAGVSAGDTVAMRIVRDDTPREVEPPPDLTSALAGDPEAEVGWAKLPFSRRDEMVSWIGSAKRTETRERRVETAVERLRTGARLR